MAYVSSDWQGWDAGISAEIKTPTFKNEEKLEEEYGDALLSIAEMVSSAARSDTEAFRFLAHNLVKIVTEGVRITRLRKG
jgi:hypothetical protein